AGLALAARTRHRRRAALYAAIVAASVVTLLSMPSGAALWATFHGATPPFVNVGEDGSGTSVLRTVPGREPGVVVFANGVGQSWIPYGGIHTVLGALPAFIHPHPRSAAVIGLGSGDTLFGLAGRQELERITCVEIIRPQLATLGDLLERWRYPGLVEILNVPRIAHVYGDGRMHVRLAPQPYDIIEADALRPTSAYSGLLYSDAYFSLIRDRLAPGGLAVSWSPTARVHNTFVSVFPHVVSYGDIVIGSNQPIAFDADSVRRRLQDPRARRRLPRAHATRVRTARRPVRVRRHQHRSLPQGRVFGAAQDSLRRCSAALEGCPLRHVAQPLRAARAETCSAALKGCPRGGWQA